ncbi:MAG: ABC transporter permease [Planctomycetota bacterium]
MTESSSYRPEPGAPNHARSPDGVQAAWRDRVFWGAMVAVCTGYVVMLIALVLADIVFLTAPSAASDPQQEESVFVAALKDPDIRYAVRLTLVSCTITAILSAAVAVPIGYLLSRNSFRGKSVVDTILDIPIVLPPLVIGLSLLILFQSMPEALRRAVVYQVPAVILAQFVVASAFAIRVMRGTFDQIDPRREQVALTLGASRFQAFGRVVLPEANSGLVAALLLAWARAFGEFGPLLVFAGATRGKTEVLSTTVFLELSVGDVRSAVAVSLLMVVTSLAVLTLVRAASGRRVGL